MNKDILKMVMVLTSEVIVQLAYIAAGVYLLYQGFPRCGVFCLIVSTLVSFSYKEKSKEEE